MTDQRVSDRWARVAAVFLAVSYGIAAPLTAFLEYRNAIFSQRFDYPPTLIYVTCVVQVLCVFSLFSRRLAPWAAAALTIITFGAAASHLKIGSPLTAVPAVLFSGMVASKAAGASVGGSFTSTMESVKIAVSVSALALPRKKRPRTTTRSGYLRIGRRSAWGASDGERRRRHRRTANRSQSRARAAR